MFINPGYCQSRFPPFFPPIFLQILSWHNFWTTYAGDLKVCVQIFFWRPFKSHQIEYGSITLRWLWFWPWPIFLCFLRITQQLFTLGTSNFVCIYLLKPFLYDIIFIRVYVLEVTLKWPWPWVLLKMACFDFCSWLTNHTRWDLQLAFVYSHLNALPHDRSFL